MKSMRGALALPLAPIFLIVFCCTMQLGCGNDDEPAATDLARERAERPAPTPEPMRDSGKQPAREPVDAAVGDPAPIILELEETIEVGDLYPEDAPLYPGVQPSKLTQSADGKVALMMGTDASPGEAVEVMSSAAEAQGWTILSEQVMGDSGSLVIAEKGGRQLRMLVSRLESPEAGEKTLVAVSVDP